MRYNILSLSSEEKVLQAFPSLMEWPSFVEYGAGANDVWLRFVIYFCDKKSPFAHLLTEDRLHACIEAAGVADNDSRRKEVLNWEPWTLQDMADRLTGPYPPQTLTPSDGILKMAVDYITLQAPNTVAALVAHKRLLWEVAESLVVPITKDNAEEVIRIQEEYKRRLDLAESTCSIAQNIDALADDMRESELRRESWREQRQNRRLKGASLPPLLHVQSTTKQACDVDIEKPESIELHNGFTLEDIDRIAESEPVGLILNGRYALGEQKKSAVTGFIEGLEKYGVLTYSNLRVAHIFFGARYGVEVNTDRVRKTRTRYREKTLKEVGRLFPLNKPRN